MSNPTDQNSLFEIRLQPSKVEDLENLYTRSTEDKAVDLESAFRKADANGMSQQAPVARNVKTRLKKERKKMRELQDSPFSWTQPSPWPMTDIENRKAFALAAPTLPYLISTRPTEFVWKPSIPQSAPEGFLAKAFLDKGGYDAGYPPIAVAE